MRLLTAIAITIFFGACSEKKIELKSGIWRGVVEVQGNELPFAFHIKKDSLDHLTAFIKNAQENILLDEISIKDDTVSMTLHIFDSQLKAKISGDSLNGFFIKNFEKNYKLPFKATFGQDFRFSKTTEGNTSDFSGKYAVTFINKTDTTLAVGLFKQKGNYVEGTFLTPTGDYRYLEGNVVDDTMRLSTFDGNHAYLFTAYKKNDSTLLGDYWSGKTWHESWMAIRNDNASLPDPESLTYLKPGYDKIEFSFPDIEGKLVTPTDAKYKNKVLILQILGTWCPNCMDETKFLKDWYKVNRERGVEILGLAYESNNDFAYASNRVKKMKDKLGITYEIVIAGTKDKDEASKTLPMLNGVIAFPTTIFIGRDGKVKKIHTGFSGPGTGIYYEQFIQEFNETVNELLKE